MVEVLSHSAFVIRHSSFRLPPSPQLPAPQLPRSAITLTEVLISLGILTIGLLGVAALFPVGSYYMQKGEIADRGSAIAQAAFNDAHRPRHAQSRELVDDAKR